MRKVATCKIGALIVSVAALSACGGGNGSHSQASLGGEETPIAGGGLTVFDATSKAFSLPAPNLSARELNKHNRGDRIFDQQFVSAGNDVNPGLGPIFVNDSCNSCHVNDGRGRPVDKQREATRQFLIRVSRRVGGSDKAPYPLQNFGTEFQTNSVFGVKPEVHIQIHYTKIKGQYKDGKPYTLYKPQYQFRDPYVPLPSKFQFSPRIPPRVAGSGLLAAIPESRLERLADPDDTDGDGVSGRVQWVTNAETGSEQIGRFGWKAGQPTLRQQVADAFRRDMGVTSPARPTEIGRNQVQYDNRDDDPEIQQKLLDDVAYYLATLGVPARRNRDNPKVSRGETIFTTPVRRGGGGCAACHIPTQHTAAAGKLEERLSFTFPSADSANPLANQTIHPYSDLLLHDMGPGLADHRRVFRASGREWRTPPLWGIGLSQVVNGHTSFLHDGRARSLMQAILWHGGEADHSKEAFRDMSADDRADLLAFLRSL